MMHSLPRRLASALATTIVLLVLAVPAVASAHPGPRYTPPSVGGTPGSSSAGASCTIGVNGISICSSPASAAVSVNTTSSSVGGVTCVVFPGGLSVCSSPARVVTSR